MATYISAKDIKKEYIMGEVVVQALAGASFGIEKGELAMIVGASGAGKSTMLNILGGMDTMDAGELIVDGAKIDEYSREELIEYRRHDIGFVFQFYNLMQNLTALENVELASQISLDPLEPKDVLEKVGLGHRLDNFPAQLSGGEQQRVSIARALAKNPKLLLCDEPTGALDYVTGKEVLKLLQDYNRDSHMTVVIITHNLAITPIADRVIQMRNGLIISEVINTDPKPVSKIEW